MRCLQRFLKMGKVQVLFRQEDTDRPTHFHPMIFLTNMFPTATLCKTGPLLSFVNLVRSATVPFSHRGLNDLFQRCRFRQ